MDPPQRLNETIQRQDSSATDLPMPLIADLDAMHIYEVFPEDNAARLYESNLDGLIPPTESQPKPPGHVWDHGGGGSGNTDYEITNGRLPVCGPRPPLRTRLPSACFPGRQGPPPVPPRTRIPLKKRFSCDFTEPVHKLNRSRTEIDNHVSISSSFCLSKDKKLLYDSIK